MANQNNEFLQSELRPTAFYSQINLKQSLETLDGDSVMSFWS